MEINFSNPQHIYFIGIGGISMSGLADLLLSEGFRVSGSDAKESSLTKDLAAKGATIYYGQEVSHITDDVDLVVYTAAIREDNAEFICMKEKNIPSVTRAEFLGLVMKNYKTPIAVSGTHGKTTTTSMISEIMLAADTDPTLNIGGVLQSIGSNTRNGSDDFFVFEACEYTNSFLSFFPKISVILNVEEDHLDFFKDIDDIRNSFNRFAKLLPEDGFLVVNGEIEALEKVIDDIACPYVTYGPDDRFDYYPSDISFDAFGCPSYTCHFKNKGITHKFKLGVTGMHNVYNSLAAVAVADYLGLDMDTVEKALLNCSGSKRRFEKKGSFNGVTVVDDYAHHPTEIEATLKTAKNVEYNTLWCVFQPHTYTRTKAFLQDFAKALSIADRVVLAEVYPAREKDIYGCNSQNLYEELISLGAKCDYLHSFEDIKVFLHKNCINGDLLITMGAGDIVKIADELVSE
ncbi:MAG: UDP-N-acetylmuramate--L-alanine ligase [Lachnospiraceae bacterium]|nr:UDP-N-acetylmuramate--L-alanine ligase [Lachnospiraceae bacterium]